MAMCRTGGAAATIRLDGLADPTADLLAAAVTAAHQHARWIAGLPDQTPFGLARLELHQLIWWMRAMPGIDQAAIDVVADILDVFDGGLPDAVRQMTANAIVDRDRQLDVRTLGVPADRFDAVKLSQAGTTDRRAGQVVGEVDNGMPAGLVARLVGRQLHAEAQAEPTSTILLSSPETIAAIRWRTDLRWAPHGPLDVVGLLLAGDTPHGRVVLSGPAPLTAILPDDENAPTIPQLAESPLFRSWVRMPGPVAAGEVDRFYRAWLDARAAGSTVDPAALLAVL